MLNDMTKYCIQCNKECVKRSNESQNTWIRRKFCSPDCKKEHQIGRPGAGLGIPKSTPEYSHHKWKGDAAGYISIHKWVAKHRGKPQECEFCGTTEVKLYHWANVSGDYLRDLDDYIRLCPSCHKNFDRQKGYGTKAQFLERGRV